MASVFFDAAAATEVCTLSLHDALPILVENLATVPARVTPARVNAQQAIGAAVANLYPALRTVPAGRSEEHTSELQSQSNLVCRLLLEKNKTPRKVLPRYARRTPASCMI